MTIVRTASGIDFDLLYPRPEMVRFTDIAQHLAQINRYSGAARLPVSVAQHSVLVADILVDMNCSPATCLAGLLHDAHEAYLGDIPAPVKAVMEKHHHYAGLFHLSARIDNTVHQAAGLDYQYMVQVDRADERALLNEWRDLMPGVAPKVSERLDRARAVKPLPWARAEELWRDRLCELVVAAAVQPLKSAIAGLPL